MLLPILVSGLADGSHVVKTNAGNIGQGKKLYVNLFPQEGNVGLVQGNISAVSTS